MSLIPKQEYLKKYSGKNGLSIDVYTDADAADSDFNSKIRSIRDFLIEPHKTVLSKDDAFQFI